MKLDDDFNSAFTILDTTNKGYLTTEEVLTFYQTIFCQNVGLDLADAVVKKVCSNVQCTVKDFQVVLVLLEEWRQRESNAYWDFQSLDIDGSHTVAVSSAMFLARSIRGSEFSLEIWNGWLQSRNTPQMKISWDEFKNYLYYEPTDQIVKPLQEATFNNAKDRLSKEELQYEVDEYQFYKSSLEKDEVFSAQLLREQQLYQEDVRNEAGRLVNRWNIGGVEAVIHDNGAEWDQVDTSLSKDNVTITELFAALDEKYDVLRDKLIRELVKAQYGIDNSQKKINQSELEERVNEAKNQEKALRRSESLESGIKSLYGSDVTYGHDIHVLMGETADAYQLRWEETKRRYNAYKREGKTTEQINQIFENENLERIKNSGTSGENLLVELWNRQKQERKLITERLKHVQDAFERLTIFTAIYRQCERARESCFLPGKPAAPVSFEGSASGVALAERKQVFELNKFSEDSVRQERIAAERIRLSKNQLKTPPKVGDRLSDISQAKTLGTVDSWMEITKLMEKKHLAEREMIIHFFKTIGNYEMSVRKLDVRQQEMRCGQLSRTFDSWKEQVLEASGKESARRPYQLAVLHEGVALYKEKMKRSHSAQKDSDLYSLILSRLQILQDIQYQDVQKQLKSKSVAEIYQLRKAEYRAIRDEHFENIAVLLFGSEQLSAEEMALERVISNKYDALRSKLFSEHLRYLRKENEREKALNQLLEEERSSRNSREHLASLCKRLKIMYSSKELFGPFYSLFRETAQANQNQERNVVIDESMLLDGPEENILSALDARQRDEFITILSFVRDSGESAKVIRRVKEEQLWETAALETEESFLPAALTLGLLERAREGGEKTRLREDAQRYIRCAQERFPMPEPFNEKAKDLFVSENEAMTSVLQTHAANLCDEWKRLRSLMSDVTAEELREAASVMTLDERIKRLAEINKKRKTLDLTKADGKDDLLSLLEEAAALKHVCRREILSRMLGESGASDDDVIISLLADLHEEQLADGLRCLNKAAKVDSANASNLSDEINSHMDSCENIFRILCKYEGMADDDNLFQALEDKYDSLRDKLLTDALMRQIGESAWRRMSERERQEKLLKLRMEEMRLRKEGKMDALAQLLGDAFSNDARLRGLLGESREMYEKKLRERLEARKRGEVIPEEVEDLSVTNGSHNPLVDLASRMEEEKEALMRMLSGHGDAYLSEKDRQAALFKLKQSRMRANMEDHYEAAALVSGLSEREAAAGRRFESDRERQRELARRRLEELRRRSGKLSAISEEEEEIVREGGREALEEALFKKLRFLQSWERAWLAALLKNVQDPFPATSTMSMQQIDDRMQVCRTRVPDGFVVVENHRQPLSDAAFYRLVALARHVVQANDQSREELHVTVLAELQDAQDKEESELSRRLTEMSDHEVIASQEEYVTRIRSGSSGCVPDSIFSSLLSSNTEDDLMDALAGKYEAVIDSLAAKVLPDKVGVSNWDSMSPAEQHSKIADLSSRVKDLMAAGRYDDALELLTEGLSEEMKEEITNLLLGDEKERRMTDQKEREKRREERIKNGMSPEEADRLFKKEGLIFEEQEKKRRRNILEGLHMDLNAERDALLKALQDSKDKLDAEKKRQALLTKLRLQERLLRREDDLSSVAKLLAMSRYQDDALEEERRRQLKLARDRIEALKRKKTNDGKEDDIDLRLDSDDVVVLADAVLREMETKHAAERTALVELMELVGPDAELRVKAEKYSPSESQIRIRELRDMRKHWRNEDPQTMLESQEEHWHILKDSAALQLSTLHALRPLEEDEAQALLLADLQSEQKKETAHLLSGLLEKKPTVVRKLAEVQRQARKGCWYDNVARSLLGSSDSQEKSDEEEEVVKALEEKYDALKDKLLAEALMKKLGQKEWEALSEQERQRRITQIKLKEKKLRREGKHDEAAELFNALAITEQDVARIFGEERASQEEALKNRRKRILELRRQRKERGLPVNDDAIEKEIDEEEKVEKRKRTNVLLTLDRNLDAEKEALLTSLRKQEDSISEERKRQLAVAQLRRQRRQVETEERINAISFIFSAAKKDEETLAASRTADRERQATLAIERLSSKKTERQRKQAVAALTNPSTILEKLNKINNETNEGSSAERLLLEMEKKHADEKETLTHLFLAVEDKKLMLEDAKNLSKEKMDEKLESFSKARRTWREERMMRAITENSDLRLTDDQCFRLSGYVATQNKQLIEALQVKSEECYRESSEDTDKATRKTKVFADWLTELSRVQENEMETTVDLIADKTDELLDVLSPDQKRARREGWNDNIMNVVFGLSLPGQEQRRPASSSSSIEQEEREMEEEAKKKMREIEMELKEEKKKIQRQKVQGEVVDVNSAFSELEQQFAHKKEAISEDMERQRKQMRDKLRERRQKREESAYEAHAAVGMVLLAEQRLKAKEKQNKSDAEKNKNLMQERLAARREKRRLEQPKQERTEEQPTVEDSQNVSQIATPAPPIEALKRERTVINFTENDKERMLQELHNKSVEYQNQLRNFRAKQQATVKKKLEKAKERQQRKAVVAGEAESLLREQTIVIEKKSAMLERQKTILADRLVKLKTDRTMTMKEKSQKKVQEFSKRVAVEQTDGLDKDEQMEEFAKQLQKKLMEETVEEKQSSASSSNAASSDPPATSNNDAFESLPPRSRAASRKLGQQEKDRILKERMKKKRNKKQEQEETEDPTEP